MYAILDGTHYNDACCFDYGNAETSSRDTGNGHMEAIYYGDNTVWGSGSGQYFSPSLTELIRYPFSSCWEFNLSL